MLRALRWLSSWGVKQVSMPSQCVTHKLSKELSKFFFLGGSIFYIHNIIVLVEEGEYGEIFLVSALKKALFN